MGSASPPDTAQRETAIAVDGRACVGLVPAHGKVRSSSLAEDEAPQGAGEEEGARREAADREEAGDDRREEDAEEEGRTGLGVTA